MLFLSTVINALRVDRVPHVTNVRPRTRRLPCRPGLLVEHAKPQILIRVGHVLLEQPRVTIPTRDRGHQLVCYCLILFLDRVSRPKVAISIHATAAAKMLETVVICACRVTERSCEAWSQTQKRFNDVHRISPFQRDRLSHT